MKAIFLLIAILLQSGPLFAATTADWKGAAAADWTATTSWVGAIPPNGVDDVANFKNPGTGGTTVNLNAGQTVGFVNFDYSAAYTISGANTLTFQTASTTTAITITTANGSGAHTISSDLSLSSPLLVTQGSTADFTLSGIISGGESITKAGTGVLVLGGVNSYSGGTVISAGTVSVTVDTNLGNVAGGVTIGTATLEFDNGGAVTSTRPYALTGAAVINTAGLLLNTVQLNPAAGITGAGSLTKVGSGTLQLVTSNSYLGGTTISAGTLSISNDNQLGNTAGALNIGTATLGTTANVTSARSGTITGNPSTIDTGGFTDTFSGNFSGSGSLAISGTGTVIFTGINSYTGPTTLSGAGTTLSGTTTGIQGNLSLGAGTHLIFNQTTTGTYAGVITGSGTLQKTGTGTVTLSGNSSAYTGTTTVSNGTLDVDGTLTLSTVTVAIGATLGGSGTVGSVINNGTIDPGHGTTLGTLTVTGALNPTGHVIINISPSASDVIAVTGTATLTGATLTVDPVPGFYGFDVCYTILTSGGLVGSFASATSTDSGFVPTVTNVGNNVRLCVVISQPFAHFPFSNENTQAVGNNIDALHAAGEISPDLSAILSSLVGQSIASVNRALDEMHPAPYSAFTEMQTEVGGELISRFHRLPYLSQGCSYSNRFWIEPYGNSLTVKHHGMQFGFQGNSGGIALGYDGEVRDCWYLGFGGAWNQSHLHWMEHHGRGEVNGFYGSVYTDFQRDKFYLGAVLLAGADLYDTSRHIEFTTTNRHARADFTALDVMAQVSTAYIFGSNEGIFYPYADLDLLYLHTPKFNEHGAGALNLNVADRTDMTLRTEMGLALQFQDTNMADTMSIIPRISLGWVNLCPLQRDRFRSNFEGTTIPFTTEGWEETWNLMNVDFGLAFSSYSFTFGLDYNFEFSPDSGTLLFNQHGNISLNWNW